MPRPIKTILFGVVLTAVIFVVGQVVSSTEIAFTPCRRNVEFTFRAIDGNTGAPIVGAKMLIRTEDPITLVTDDNGQATLLRKLMAVQERLTLPFRLTITLVGAESWLVSVDAQGYHSLKNAELSGRRFEDKGFLESENLQRVEFTIPLEPQ